MLSIEFKCFLFYVHPNSFGFYLTRNKYRNVCLRKYIVWEYILNVISVLSAGFCNVISQTLSSVLYEHFRKSFQEMTCKIVSYKLSEQAFPPLSALVVPSEVVDFWQKADQIADTENNVKCRESSLLVCSYTDPTRILLWTWLCLGCNPRHKWQSSNMQFSKWVISGQQIQRANTIVLPW